MERGYDMLWSTGTNLRQKPKELCLTLHPDIRCEIIPTLVGQISTIMGARSVVGEIQAAVAGVDGAITEGNITTAHSI